MTPLSSLRSPLVSLHSSLSAYVDHHVIVSTLSSLTEQVIINDQSRIINELQSKYSSLSSQYSSLHSSLSPAINDLMTESDGLDDSITTLQSESDQLIEELRAEEERLKELQDWKTSEKRSIYLSTARIDLSRLTDPEPPHLPLRPLSMIASFLCDYQQYYSMSLVCKRWQRLWMNPMLLKSLTVGLASFIIRCYKKDLSQSKFAMTRKGGVSGLSNAVTMALQKTIGGRLGDIEIAHPSKVSIPLMIANHSSSVDGTTLTKPQIFRYSLQQMEKQMEPTINELNDIAHRYLQLEESKKKLQDQLLLLSDNNGKLSIEYGELIDKIGRQNYEKEQLAKRVNQLEKQLKEEKKLTEDAEKYRKTSLKNAEYKLSMIREVDQWVAELKSEVEKQTNTDKVSMINQLKQQKKVLIKAIKNMQQQLNQLTHENDEYQQIIHDWQSKLITLQT